MSTTGQKSCHLLHSEKMHAINLALKSAEAEHAAASNQYRTLLSAGGPNLTRARATITSTRISVANCRKRLANATKNWRPDVPVGISEAIAQDKNIGLAACIEWQGNKNRNGYGLTRFKGRRELAHRLVYAIANDIAVDDIVGLVIRHRCDNPACTRPSHLLIGTQADNVSDMYQRGRNVNVSIRGSAAGTSKLKESDIPIIRQRIKNGTKRRVIAQEFGVSKSAIARICGGQSWVHV